MSNLVFPSAGKPYRGFVDKIRNMAREIATYLQNSPKARAEVVSQLAPLLNSGTTTLVTTGATVAVKNSAGSKTVSGATVDVAAGALEDVNLPATAALITSAQALTGVTPSGTYTNTVTFTVAAGVITAIALS